MSRANFMLTSKKGIVVFFPEDLTDDELLELLATMANNLPLRKRLQHREDVVIPVTSVS